MDKNTVNYLFGLAMILAVFLFGIWYDRRGKRNGKD